MREVVRSKSTGKFMPKQYAKERPEDSRKEWINWTMWGPPPAWPKKK